jgi:hypothetical protein
MCLEIFPLSIKVVKFLWNFEPETSNFGRCYSSNLLDAADMVRYDRGWGSQNARDKLTTMTQEWTNTILLIYDHILRILYCHLSICICL